MAYWKVSLEKIKGIFMMQSRLQDSVKAWPVLHNLKGISIGVLFFFLDWLRAISGCQTEF